MACDNILYYEPEECATNYAGVSQHIFLVPLSPSSEAGQNNLALIRDWNAVNKIGGQSGSFRSLRLPPVPDGEDEPTEAMIKGAVIVEIDPLKSSFVSPSSGPKRGKMFASELKAALIARSVDEVDLQLSLTLSNNIGVVFRDANGCYRLMADPDFPVDAQTDDQSGEGPSSEASATVTFSQNAPHPPFFYFGKIAYGVSFDPKDSIKTIDCMTGMMV